MAITVTLAVSNTNVTVGEMVDLQITVSNSGGSAVNVTKAMLYMTPNWGYVTNDVRPGNGSWTVPAGGSLILNGAAVAEVTRYPITDQVAYTFGAMVSTDDGSTTYASPTVMTWVNPLGNVMPDSGQLRGDSNLLTYMIPLFGI